MLRDAVHDWHAPCYHISQIETEKTKIWVDDKSVLIETGRANEILQVSPNSNNSLTPTVCVQVKGRSALHNY